MGSVSLVYYTYHPFIESISTEPRGKLAVSSQRTGMTVLQPLWLRSPSTYTMNCLRSTEEIRNGGTAASRPSKSTSLINVAVKQSRRSIGSVVQHRLSNIVASSLHFLSSDVISQPYGNRKYNRPSNPSRVHGWSLLKRKVQDSQ